MVSVSNAQDDEQDCVAYGHSQIIDPLGRVMNVCENHCEDEIVVSEMTMKQMIKVRNHLIPLESCKRPIIYEDALRSVQSMPSAMMRPPTGTDSKN